MKEELRLWAGRLIVVACASLAALPGCMVGPNFKRPVTSMPSGWAGISPESATQPSAATTTPAELTVWWQVFNDPLLSKLVDQSLQANLTLQNAKAALRQAQAQRGVEVGGLLPTVNVPLSYQRAANGGKGLGAGPHNVYSTGVNAALNVDVFGGIRRSIEVDDANILAAMDNIRDVQVLISAEVAADYVSVRSFQQQIIVAQRNLVAQRHTADITRQKLAAGFVSSLDVANADAQVATTESTIPSLQIGERQNIYAISVLLGRPPADLVTELSIDEPLPTVPARIPVGLPSELLRRRPDIRQAEDKLHAATAQIGVATANLFPQFSLTGNLNWNAFDASKWFNPINRSWGFGPSMSWAIFQGGSVLASIEVDKALRDESFLTYQQTVLTALQDVENALIAFTKEQEHLKSLSDAVVANQKATDVSMQLYAQGQTDFLNVLNAQRSLFVSEAALVQSQQAVATDLISLYQALGGGWDQPGSTSKPAGKQAAESTN